MARIKEIMKRIISFFLGFATSYTVVSKAAENPDGIKKTVIKTGRTVACGIGIVLDIVAMIVCSAIFGSITNPVVRTVGQIIGILLLYTVWGLVRVAGSKPFWINPVMIYRRIQTTKVPKIAYIAIELFVTVLMTKPVLAFIDSFTVEWANQNQDAVSDSLVITLGAAMLAGSIIISAVIGLIVCMLIKAITAIKDPAAS